MAVPEIYSDPAQAPNSKASQARKQKRLRLKFGVILFAGLTLVAFVAMAVEKVQEARDRIT
jgi:hypothetical protein